MFLALWNLFVVLFVYHATILWMQHLGILKGKLK